MGRGAGKALWGTFLGMDRLIAILARGPVLVGLLVISIAVSVGFGLVDNGLGGPLLDLVAGREANEARLAAMSAAQKATHLRITLTLDLLYPMAYGGGLASLAARFAPRRKLLAAAPALALIVVDMFENVLIAAMLSGHDGVIALKTAATEAKWALFLLCCVIALALAAAAMFRHYACAARCADA